MTTEPQTQDEMFFERMSYLLGASPSDADSFVLRPLSSRDGYICAADIEDAGKVSDQGFIGASIDGRRGQRDLEDHIRSLAHGSGDRRSASSRSDTNGKHRAVAAV